jgi:hypothetical protein
MSDQGFRGAFGHQHGDPRGLLERIQAQLRERIQEAVEMAGLELMVESRRRGGRPAPDTDSAADRKEFADTSRAVLGHLRSAFHADLDAAQRAALERAEAQPGEPEPLIAGQALLARELPDYWQRFDAYRAAYTRACLDSPPPRGGWLGRLLGGDQAARKSGSEG